MEDINNIKLMWQDLNGRLSHLEDENKKLMNRVMQNNYHSTREQLIRKYIMFIYLECLMITFMTLFFIFNPELNEEYRYAALIYWDIFFLIEVAIDIILMLRVKKINIYSSSIKEVAREARENWKLHKLAILAGLPLALGAIILFALALNANEFVIIGMAAGGAVGLAIGIGQLIKFRNYYRLLQTD